jgi:translation initiation factor IF-2
MNRRLLTAFGLVLAAAAASAAVAADRAAPAPAAAPARAAPAEERGAAGPTPRLAAWRDSARRPADVPPTALVRAARRDRIAGKRRAGAQPVKPEPVEIIWHAPGSH